MEFKDTEYLCDKQGEATGDVATHNDAGVTSCDFAANLLVMSASLAEEC